jgi:hypothetical protein
VALSITDEQTGLSATTISHYNEFLGKHRGLSNGGINSLVSCGGCHVALNSSVAHPIMRGSASGSAERLLVGKFLTNGSLAAKIIITAVDGSASGRWYDVV